MLPAVRRGGVFVPPPGYERARSVLRDFPLSLLVQYQYTRKVLQCAHRRIMRGRKKQIGVCTTGANLAAGEFVHHMVPTVRACEPLKETTKANTDCLGASLSDASDMLLITHFLSFSPHRPSQALVLLSTLSSPEKTTFRQKTARDGSLFISVLSARLYPILNKIKSGHTWR